ncbi:DUF6093 family protein [Nocardioides sp. AX2bis]|uniref:DUF6093 family protein n=1 Tax=Nocardioides sp. AX2bis TaxID=2653157 RepID=UPI0012F00B51|nr:DUF6093 family protein [Nocardioides sp. AX2bis]VXC44199.1 conserved hypothetical protein [Nocardioides sp. AX2bis]
MPRPRRSYGRTGTRVIPTTWAAEHADVLATTYASTVRIGPLGGTRWNSETKASEAVPADTVYAGAASITPSADNGAISDVVDDPTSARAYEVKLPADVAGIDPEAHHVWVDDCPDADLVGRRLSVQSVERGERRFSRVLQTTLDG